MNKGSSPLKIMQMLPALNSGGVECCVAELAEAVVAAGHESMVVSEGGRMEESLRKKGSRLITMPLGRKSLSTLRQIKKVRALFLEEKPDIVHVHSRIPAWVAYLAWRKLPHENPKTGYKRPCLISSVHGLHSVSFYSRIMTCGQRVVTVSQTAYDYVVKNYPTVEKSKLRIIPLGVDTKQYFPGFRPSAQWMEAWQREYPELVGKWVLCLPGRLTRIKGQADFLEILAGLKQKGLPVHGIMVGEAHPRQATYRLELEKKVEELGLSAEVTFCGHRGDLREIFCVSDVVLSLTTKPESFGRTTLEALALGRAVLGYAHGGVEEQLNVFLPEGKVALGDKRGCIERLSSWYESPPALPQKVLSPYLLSETTGAHLALYQEMAQKREEKKL